jgi:hypothetical protein
MDLESRLAPTEVAVKQRVDPSPVLALHGGEHGLDDLIHEARVVVVDDPLASAVPVGQCARYVAAMSSSPCPALDAAVR